MTLYFIAHKVRFINMESLWVCLSRSRSLLHSYAISLACSHLPLRRALSALSPSPAPLCLECPIMQRNKEPFFNYNWRRVGPQLRSAVAASDGLAGGGRRLAGFIPLLCMLGIFILVNSTDYNRIVFIYVSLLNTQLRQHLCNWCKVPPVTADVT